MYKINMHFITTPTTREGAQKQLFAILILKFSIFIIEMRIK